MGNLRGIRLACVLATAASLFVAAPTDAAPDPVAAWVERADDRFMYWAGRAGVPRELLDGLQATDPLESHVVFNVPWPDMTGDGLDEVLAVDFDFGPAGLSLTGAETHLTVLAGRTGEVVWTHDEKAFALPIQTRLGHKARNGVLLASIDLPQDTITFRALDHRGRVSYEHAFSASSSIDRGQFTGREDMVSFQLLDARPGRATDLLVGLANVRELPRVHPAAPALAARTRTVIVDGKTGELVAHPDAEPGVGRVPVPLAGPDLDGDGLEDVVVTYVLPDVAYDEETGLPLLPDTTAEYLRARRGVDGGKLWTSQPLELAAEWESPPLLVSPEFGDATRDERGEVLLHYDYNPFLSPVFRYRWPNADGAGVWSVDGETGKPLWHRELRAPLVVGDVNGDARRDLVAGMDVSERRRSGTRLHVLSGRDGSDLASGFFAVDRKEGETVESYVFPAGDLRDDGVVDLGVVQTLRREDADGRWRWRILDPLYASGRTVDPYWKRSRHPYVWPMLASFDGDGDDLAAYRPEDPPDTASVVDGRTRRTLLRVRLDIPLTLPTDDDYLAAYAARVDRDRCSDLVGTLENGTATFAVAIDGGSGKLLWARRQLGLAVGDPVRQTVRLDRNRSC